MRNPETKLNNHTTVVVAAWIFRLHEQGVTSLNEAIHKACVAIHQANDGPNRDAAGLALVDKVQAVVGDVEPEPSQLLAIARDLFGDRVVHDMGQGTREERARRIRKRQFKQPLPWLARIWERHSDGRVAPNWLIIERVTDQVMAMDPNPWDDVAEQRMVPVADFQVLWELDGCPSVAIGPLNENPK